MGFDLRPFLRNSWPDKEGIKTSPHNLILNPSHSYFNHFKNPKATSQKPYYCTFYVICVKFPPALIIICSRNKIKLKITLLKPSSSWNNFRWPKKPQPNIHDSVALPVGELKVCKISLPRKCPAYLNATLSSSRAHI